MKCSPPMSSLSPKDTETSAAQNLAPYTASKRRSPTKVLVRRGEPLDSQFRLVCVLHLQAGSFVKELFLVSACLGLRGGEDDDLLYLQAVAISAGSQLCRRLANSPPVALFSRYRSICRSSQTIKDSTAPRSKALRVSSTPKQNLPESVAISVLSNHSEIG
jgi:hypothetical protein